MSEIIITKLTIDDLETFWGFFEKNLRKYFSDEFTERTLDYFLNGAYSKDSAKESMNNDKAGVYIAKAGNEIIGFLWQSGEASGGVAFGDWLAVDENFQGRGIGSKLLKAWEDDCLKKGVHALRLSNEESTLKFYEKNGFKLIGFFPKGNYGIDTYLMYKHIQEPKEENYLN